MSRPERAGLQPLQARCLEDLTGRRSGTAEERAKVFEAPPLGTVEQRWHVYTSGYQARLVEAIENDYPATRRILGEGAFRSLVVRYVRARPPRSFDIGRTGDRLPGFLDSDPLARDLPFLPDLARFEWALAEAFVAADGEPLGWSELAELGPEAVAATRFALQPGVALVRSRWPLLDLWRCQDLPDEAVSVPVEGRACNALLYRRGLELRRRAVSDPDAEFLERASEGFRLDDMAQEGATGPETDALVARFRFWVLEGLFERPRSLHGAGSPSV